MEDSADSYLLRRVGVAQIDNIPSKRSTVSDEKVAPVDLDASERLVAQAADLPRVLP